MTKLAIAISFCCVTLGGVAAQAADLGGEIQNFGAPRPVGNWTGFYIGANAGYGWASYNSSGTAGTIVNSNGGAAPFGFSMPLTCSPICPRL
jgi:outer membrane immunogenic protein